MVQVLPSVTGDAGVNGVGLLVNTQLRGWIFRPQRETDVGIDAQIEPVLGGRASGRFLALQIKSGVSYFSEPTSAEDGWVYREDSQDHRDYWLNCVLPVLLVLYNPEMHVAYWQHVNANTAVNTGKGFKVVVPGTQRLEAASYDTLAALAREAPPDGLTEVLDGLPTSCANRLRTWDQTDPTAARHLARALVEGRRNPRDAVMHQTASWGAGQPWIAWAAIGEYANEYELPELAANCFLRAEQAATEVAGKRRMRAFAGLLLSNCQPERARSVLIDCATEPETRLLAAVGLAALDHGDNPGPIPVPDEVAADPETAAAEPTVQRFLADQYMRTGDLDRAIVHHEQALAHAPDSVSQQLALADALLHRGGAAGGAFAMADYRHAVRLAEAARTELRRWRGNSVCAAATLMRARILAIDDESAFRVAIVPPEGEATTEEATSPELAFIAARIAYERGDVERGDRLSVVVESSQEPVWQTQLAAARAEALGADADEREQLWRKVLAAEIDDGQRTVACYHLAGLGRWPLAALEAMHHAQRLTPGVYDVLHARALAASGDTSQAVALLRSHRSSSLIAAEAHAQQLAALGRVDECVRACEQAATRLGAAQLELYALDVLTRAGRVDEVFSRGMALLGRTDLPFRLRHHIRAKLIDHHTGRQQWNLAEQLANNGLQEIRNLQDDLIAGRTHPLIYPTAAAPHLAEYRRQYAWMIVISQFNQGQDTRAFTTLLALAPEARTATEIGAWFDLHQIHGWTAETAEIALRVAQRSGQPADLVGRMLFSLLQSIPEPDRASNEEREPNSSIPHHPDFHERLHQAWRAHIDEHSPPGVQIITGDGQVLDHVRAMLEVNAAQNIRVHEAIWTGKLPVGAASTVGSQPYLLSLLQRTAGFLPAVSASEEEYRREIQHAGEARDGAVSVESSAVYVAAAVLGRWPAIAVEFADLLIAEPTERDILVSHVVARSLTNVIGTASLSPDSGRLRLSELSDDVRTRILNHSNAVRGAAQDCRLMPVDNLDILGAGIPIRLFGAWMAPVALAVQQQIPLYSDDAVLRAMARAKGVPAFGTLALVDCLVTTGRLRPSDVEAVLPALFEHQIVDLPYVAQLVLNSFDSNGILTVPVLANLSRPVMWQPVAADAARIVAGLASAIGMDDPHSLATLATACATGYSAACGPPEAVTAIVAAVILAYVTGVTAEAARVVVPAVQVAAAQHGANPVANLRTYLVGILTDPTEEFQLTVEQAEDLVQAALAEFA